MGITEKHWEKKLYMKTQQKKKLKKTHPKEDCGPNPESLAAHGKWAYCEHVTASRGTEEGKVQLAHTQVLRKHKS